MNDVLEEGERTSTVLASPRRWVALAVLLGATFIGTVNNSIMNVALPRIADDFDVPLTRAVWMVAGFALSLATMMPLAGRLGDVYGPRRVFQYSMVTFALASLLVAVAPTVEIAVAGRVLQGASGAPVLPCVMATIARIFPTEHRGRAVGLWAAVNSGALALGPAIGGLLIDLAGWRAIFWASAPAIIVVGIATAMLVPDDAPPRRPSIDVIGGVLLTVGVFGVVSPLNLVEQLGITHPAVWGIVAVAIVAFVALRHRHTRVAVPFLDMSIIGQRRFRLITLAAALQMVALFGITLLVPVYLVDGLGKSTGVAGLITATLAGSMFLFATVAGRLAERRSFASLAAQGGTLMVVGLLGALAAPGNLGVLVVALFLCGLGISCIQAPATVAITLSVPPSQTGVATGLFNMARFVAGGFGATAAALTLERAGGVESLTAVRSALLVPLGGACAVLVVALVLSRNP